MFRHLAPLRGLPQPTGPNGLILIIIIIIIVTIIIIIIIYYECDFL